MNRDTILIVLALILGIIIIWMVQFLTPTLYDADGYLHIRMAGFLKELGPKYDFHWARYSTFTTNFSDKDFLYHIFLIPFTFFKDIFFGAKIAGAFFASLLFIGFYILLKKYTDKKIFLFMLTAFFLSAPFLESINSPRPMALVMLVNILAVHLIIQKRYLALFFTGLFYALLHVTSPLLIWLTILVEMIRYFHERRFCWKNIFAASFGVVIGFLIHPNFPNNFLVFYLNSILVPYYTIKTGVLELGAEFFPLNTRDYFLGYPTVIIGIIFIMYLAISKRPECRFETRVFLGLSAFFFILSFICKRYLDHGYLIMMLGLGAYISDFLKKDRLKVLVGTAIIFLLVIFSVSTFYRVRYNAFVARIINGHYEKVGRWMAQHIPPGELIFHANWSDSQYFIGLNPKNDYFVTLDPVYMYKKNPELYRLYRDLAFGRVSEPYAILKDIFKTRYGYVGKNYFGALIYQIRMDKNFVILYEDNLGVVFKLIS